MNSRSFNRTKIIATVGPACSDFHTLKLMAEAGMDVCRINFSHSNHAQVIEILQSIFKLNSENKFNISILADLQGPKLRVGEMPSEGIELNDGEVVKITNKECIGSSEIFTLRYKNIKEDIIPGARILLDDGKIEVEITKQENKNVVEAKIIRGGILKSNKGFNIPGAKLSIPGLTEKDDQDLQFILNQEIDWIALSFVRNAEDIIRLKTLISHKNKSHRVIAKIEKPEAVENFSSILDVSDGIMIARGDLGIEMPLQAVPLIQKNIVQQCIYAAKPVIVATQMMESMIENTIPTRAEVSDVANAVIDGSDAVMLSGETSIGKHPILTVSTMDKIITDVEQDQRVYYKGTAPKDCSKMIVADEISYTAVRMSNHLKAKGIVVMTLSGSSAQKIAAQRPKSRLFVFSENRKLLKALNLIWGIKTFYYEDYISTDKTISDTDNLLKGIGLVEINDIIIHTASMPINNRGQVNTIKISIIE